MNDLKHEGKLSTKNSVLILVCLTIALLGVALFRIYFPALRNELPDVLFIATLLVAMIGFFGGGNEFVLLCLLQFLISSIKYLKTNS